MADSLFPDYLVSGRCRIDHGAHGRQHMVVKGGNRDPAWFSMTDGEWPRLRAGYLAWLDPSNFDRQGRQRSTLAVCVQPALALSGAIP